MKKISDFTPEEIKRFEEIRAIVNSYNASISRNYKPALPFISIDERMRCQQYFDLVDRKAAEALAQNPPTP